MRKQVFSYIIFQNNAEINLASAGLILVGFVLFSNCIDTLNPFFFQQELLLIISLPLLLVILSFINFPDMKNLPVNRIDIVISVFTVYITLHILFTKPVLITSNHYLVYPMLLIMYFLLKNIYFQTDYPKLKKHYTLLILVLGLIPVIIAVFEITGILPKFNSLSFITGGMLSQGALAVYMASILPFFVSVISLSGKEKRIPVFIWLFIVLSLLIIVASGSRSAWLGSVIAISYIFLQFPKIFSFLRNTSKRLRNKIILVIIIVSFTITAGYLLYAFKKDSADGRLFIWKTCFNLIKEKPAFGHGFNQFVSAFNYAQIDYFKDNPDDRYNGWLVL